MNSRERVKVAVQHQKPDRVSMGLSLTPEVFEKLKAYFRVESKLEVMDKLDADMRWLLIDYVGPELESFTDVWGVVRKPIKNQFGTYEEVVRYPMAEITSTREVEEYPWPCIEWWDYSSIKREIKKVDSVQPRWIGIGYQSIFERAWGMTGMEKLMLDLTLNPDVLCLIFDRINDFYIEQTLKILEAAEGRADMVWMADDFGSQNGMLISPDTWRQYFKPRQEKFIRSIRDKFKVKFCYHSCGSIIPIIGELVEIGIDILNPVQTRAKGMDPKYLKTTFGHNLCFFGGVDIQQTLPYGTREDICREVDGLIRSLGEDGGYIAGPSHDIQPDTPIENIITMIDMIKTATF